VKNHVSNVQPGGKAPPPFPNIATRIAIDENELSQRWGLSVKTLRRWRQEKLGPAHLKLGSRVTYLIEQIEAYERRVSRHSTSCAVYQ
jgi:hypothetical protein